MQAEGIVPLLTMVLLPATGNARLVEHPASAFLTGLLLTMLMAVCVPWLYRVLRGGRSLADPEIRQMLEELERKAGVLVLDVPVQSPSAPRLWAAA